MTDEAGDIEEGSDHTENPTVPMWTAHLSFLALLVFAGSTVAVFGRCINMLAYP